MVRPNTPISGIDHDKTVFLSVLEIYNEVVSDLLKKDGASSLKIRQNREGGFFAEGLTQKKVSNL